MSSLYEDIKAAGIEIDHHESDLYFPVTLESREILRKSGRAHTMFRSAIDGSLWFDCPFAYDPWWIEQTGRP